MPWIEVHGWGDFRLDHVDDRKLDEFVELMRANARWLKNRGLNQWSELLGPMGPAVIRSRFEEGQVFIAYKDDKAVGGIAVAEFNHRWGREDEATAYWVHNIVRHPDSPARGLGAAILHWAEGRAMSSGKKFVRMEVFAASKGLVRYYENHQYKEIDRKSFPNGELILMEKVVR